MSETEPPPIGPESPSGSESAPGSESASGSESAWEPTWEQEPAAEPDPPRPAGTHRAPVGANQLAGRVLAPLAAVVVVIVVIVLLIWINGRPPGDASSAVAHTGTPTVTLPTTSPRASRSSTPPSSTPPSTSSPSSPPTSKSTPAKTSTPANSHDANAMAPVQILNNSRRTGLAHGVAAEVEAKGWHVGIVGNLRGEISEPTVYYSPGEKAAAQHLARQFSSIKRVEPNSAAHLTATGITLVLTVDWVS